MNFSSGQALKITVLGAETWYKRKLRSIKNTDTKKKKKNTKLDLNRFMGLYLEMILCLKWSVFLQPVNYIIYIYIYTYSTLDIFTMIFLGT